MSFLFPDSLKDSNTKIAFNKGIKEARKLAKEEDEKAGKGENKSTISTPVKFVDDKAIPCSTISPYKRGRKRSAKQETKDFNDNVNQEKACRNIDFEGTCHSTRKSPRKHPASESLRSVCNGATTDKNISKKGSEGKATQRKNQTKPSEKINSKSNQGKRKRGESQKKDSLKLLVEDLQQSSSDSKNNTKLDNSAKRKATKQLFPKMDTDTTSCGYEGVNIQNGHGINVLNGEETTKGTEDSDSDDSSDRELMETVLDTSPSSKNLKFALNDVVWGKINREPYWPALVSITWTPGR